MSRRHYHRILSHRAEPGGPSVRFEALGMVLAGTAETDPSPNWDQGFESRTVRQLCQTRVTVPGRVVYTFSRADRLAARQIEAKQTKLEVVVIE